VQYFERARFEYHPDSTPHVQLGNLAPEILKARTFDRLAQPPSSDSSLYFPETGHSISGGFLDFWQANGALATFGYPLSEELSEDGLTVQYFERARMEYYKGLVGTLYGIQLSPVGYLAIKADLQSAGALPDGTLVAFNPPRVPEGHTAEITVNAAPGVTVTGSYEGRPLFFTYDPARGVAWSLIGAVAFEDLGAHEVTINIRDSSGDTRTITRDLQVVPYRFPNESLQFDAQTATLLASDVVAKEQATLTEIFSGRTPHQYWSGLFRMPLDGPINVTAPFGARRCYNCPDGSTPTSYHSGIDLAAEVGTPVHAAADGMVVFAGALSDRGNAIIMDHGLGVYTLYAHNSRLIATQGQLVQKGDVISLSGNTGLSNGPHLHWEMHVSGPPVDAPEWTKRTLP
jgi:murein DD-endopeptidase MepM/ murein hydrolase activator NlpD